MEELDEPDQPISGERQEIRKRRRPSQPMVDKSLQTEVTEKRKPTATPQSSGPKAPFSTGNTPSSKGNSSAKEYESRRISSQLQQNWKKRKHGQEMTDKSLQTDPIINEKEEINLVDETVVPEEKPVGIGVAAFELPERVQDVETPTRKPSVQSKIDRSQQTSCTGGMLKICQVEKADKEQQTSFGEFEVIVISSPSSSTKSKKDVQKTKSSENVFVSEHPEFQPETSSQEEFRQKSVDRALFTQETRTDTPVLLEGGSRAEVTIPLKEGSSVTKGASAEIEALSLEKIPAEVQPLPAEEAAANAEPNLAERTSAEAAVVTAKVLVLEQARSTEELPLTESSSVEKVIKKCYDQVGYLSAEAAPLEAFPAEIQPSLIEKCQVEVLPPIVEDAHEETLGIVEPRTAEETPAEVQPPLAQEVLAEIQPLSAEEASAEEAPAQVQPPPAKELPVEEAPGEVQAQQPEEAPAEEAPAQVQSPPAKELSVAEAPGEVQAQQPEEAPAEEAPAEVQSPPTDKAPVEEVPAQVQSQPAEEAPAEVQSPPAEETPDQIQPPSTYEAPVEEAEEASAQVQSPAEEASAEEAPAKVQSLADKVPTEDAPTTVKFPPADVAPAEEAPAQVQSQPAEVTPAQVQSQPVDEAPAEEALAPVPPPPEKASHNVWSPIPEVSAEAYSSSLEETSIEEVSEVQSHQLRDSEEEALPEVQSPPLGASEVEALADKHASLTDVVPTEEFPMQETSAEILPPSSAQARACEAVVENVSTESRSPQVAGASEKTLGSVVLKGVTKFE
ncbi:PREDICTED: LOW QUALITY PROTEIN: fibrous sheath CABYR-binding protein [Chinchilla lanigera]|uniref:LOW QUALITY PROTEIN: fibrous sheath CABYR-binding protein n=1 Tax=Chinchilla lanigera TaxID=34839 RepID=UPI0006976CDB|nr:PREDICTED: LOW QUALITY PROTEIN: fibrous sheath CABYR-binding protein [Chinchilla lanigera]